MLDRFVRLRFPGTWFLPTLSNGRFIHQLVLDVSPLLGSPRNHETNNFVGPPLAGLKF